MAGSSALRLETVLRYFLRSCPTPTCTTLGTGKHVLVSPNRVLEPVEATNGMLAGGLNTALMFSILSSMAKKHADYDDFFR